MSGKSRIISSVVPPVKIDISIRRCRKEFNQKQHLLNYSGNHFEMPKNCKNHKNSRYQCCSIELDDVMAIRHELYKTTDRNLLSEKMKSWIQIIPPKRHTTTENSKVAKLMTMFYKFPTKQQKEVPVCREMFLATTALTKSRFQTLIKKVYKKELLEQNIDSKINLKKSEMQTLKAQRLEELLTAKKEKLLSLEKGTFKEFEKVIKGSSSNPEKDSCAVISSIDQFPAGTDSCSIIEYMEDDEIYYEEEEEEFQEYTELNQLDLQSMEICRFCLQSNENLKPIFEKLDEEHSFAEMLEYGLCLQIMQDGFLPNKICENCTVKLRTACEFKSDLLESQEIMTASLQEAEETTDSSEVYQDIQEIVVQYDSDQQEQEDFMETDYIEEFDKSSSVEILEQNTNSTNHSRAEKCYLCNVNFENETDVEHFQKHHMEIKLTRCKNCMFETEFPWFLNLHYQVHEDDFRLCGACGIKCESREKYHSHKRGCERKRIPKEDRIKKDKKTFKGHELVHSQQVIF